MDVPALRAVLHPVPHAVLADRQHDHLRPALVQLTDAVAALVRTGADDHAFPGRRSDAALQRLLRGFFVLGRFPVLGRFVVFRRFLALGRFVFLRGFVALGRFLVFGRFVVFRGFLVLRRFLVLGRFPVLGCFFVLGRFFVLGCFFVLGRFVFLRGFVALGRFVLLRSLLLQTQQRAQDVALVAAIAHRIPELTPGLHRAGDVHAAPLRGNLRDALRRDGGAAAQIHRAGHRIGDAGERLLLRIIAGTVSPVLRRVGRPRRRLLRQPAREAHDRLHAAVAEDRAVGHRALLAAHAADVSLDGVCGRAADPLDDAHVVGAAPAVEREEDQIARLGPDVLSGCLIRAEPLQRIHPRPAVGRGRARSLRNARVVQAEGDEHRAPVRIRRAVPVAIAGIVVLFARLIEDEAPIVVAPADLRGGDGDEVAAPVAGQHGARNAAAPDLLILPVAPRDRHADARLGGLSAAVGDGRGDRVFAAAARHDVKARAAGRFQRHMAPAVRRAEPDLIVRCAARHAQLDVNAVLTGKGKAPVRLHADAQRLRRCLSVTFSRRVSVALGRRVSIAVGRRVSVALGRRLSVAAGRRLSIALSIGRCISVALGRRVSVAVGRRISVALGRRVSVAAGRRVSVALGRRISVALGRRISVALGRRISVALGRCISVALGRSISVALGRRVSVIVGRRVSIALRRRISVTVGRRVSVALGRRVSVGIGRRVSVIAGRRCALPAAGWRCALPAVRRRCALPAAGRRRVRVGIRRRVPAFLRQRRRLLHGLLRLQSRLRLQQCRLVRRPLQSKDVHGAQPGRHKDGHDQRERYPSLLHPHSSPVFAPPVSRVSRSGGQTRSTTRPSSCSCVSRPTAVLRESTETAR